MNGARINGNIEIIIQAPTVNGAPVFSDSELTGSYDNWQSPVITTDAGKVIMLKNTNEILNSANIRYYNVSRCYVLANSPEDVSFYPSADRENLESTGNSTFIYIQ